VYCYPLTVVDGHSRFLLACRGLLSVETRGAQVVFERLFRDHGLPERIRSDNGVPFATSALGRLSALSVWWIKLGITPELIEPSSPQQNGAHERGALLTFVDGPGAGLPVTTLVGWLSAAVSGMQDRERFWREHDAGAATASTLAKLWERGTAEIRRNGDTAAQLVRLLEELGRAGVPLAVRLREEV